MNDAVRVIEDVLKERLRQIDKWGEQTHPDHVGPLLRLAGGRRSNAEMATILKVFNDRHKNPYWSLILAEEFFEAVESEDPERLRQEPIEVAAVAVAWVEDLDTRSRNDDA